MAAGRKEQTGPMEIRPTPEYDLGELCIRTLKGLNGIRPQRNVVCFELAYRLRADLGPIAAGHHIRHPVPHHDGKLRPLTPLAICCYRFPRVFETVAVKTMMDANPVERFDPGQLGQLVYEPRRKKDFRSGAGRAVRTYKLKLLAGGADVRYPRLAHRDGLVASEFFSRLVQEVQGGPAFRESRGSSDCADDLAAGLPDEVRRPRHMGLWMQSGRSPSPR